MSDLVLFLFADVRIQQMNMYESVQVLLMCLSYPSVLEMLRIALHGTYCVFLYYVTEITTNKNTFYLRRNP
jgi:hypothetical protein